MYRAGIIHQATDPLLRLQSNGTDRTPLDNNLPVLVLTCEMPPRWKPLEQNEKENETNEQTIDSSVPSLPEVVTLADHI